MNSREAGEQEAHVLTRKVQKLGTSSLIITLPREWARRHGLKAGSMVSIVEDGDKLVVVPYVRERPLRASFELKHLNICKHLGRIVLCAYLSGLDSIEFVSNRPIRPEILERVDKAVDVIGDDGVSVRLRNAYEVAVEVEELPTDVAEALISYGRMLAGAVSRLVDLLSGAEISADELDGIYNDLRASAFRLLRIGSKGGGLRVSQEHLNRLLMAAVGLLILLNEYMRWFARDLASLRRELSDEERERLKFVLQLIEVSLVAAASGIEPPSVKKEEDAYNKLKALLDLENELSDIVRDASPAYAYLLGRLVDLARVVSNVEETILCYSLFKRYSESAEELSEQT